MSSKSKRRPEPRPPWSDMASAALRHAIREDYPAAQKCLEALAATHLDSIAEIVLAWIDSTFGKVYKSAKAAAIVHLDVQSWEMSGPSQVDPAQRWIGELVQARLTNNRNQFRRLMREFADDLTGLERGHRIGSLLRTCAATQRMADAGTLPAGGDSR